MVTISSHGWFMIVLPTFQQIFRLHLKIWTRKSETSTSTVDWTFPGEWPVTPGDPHILGGFLGLPRLWKPPNSGKHWVDGVWCSRIYHWLYHIMILCPRAIWFKQNVEDVWLKSGVTRWPRFPILACLKIGCTVYSIHPNNPSNHITLLQMVIFHGYVK